MTKKPKSLRHLDDAIRRVCGSSPEEYVRTRTLMANAIVAQMLPDGVVKGGSAIKMRFGNTTTRFTTDLDTATASDPAVYVEKLGIALARGWEGFTGRVVARDPAQPKDVPSEYVMQPFDIKLSYNGKPWCTVPLEVGHNEVGDTVEIDWIRLTDAEKIFSKLGFPALGMAPLMPLAHQVAQKLHVLTGADDRIRDLLTYSLLSRMPSLTSMQSVAYVRGCLHTERNKRGLQVLKGDPVGMSCMPSLLHNCLSSATSTKLSPGQTI